MQLDGIDDHPNKEWMEWSPNNDKEKFIAFDVDWKTLGHGGLIKNPFASTISVVLFSFVLFANCNSFNQKPPNSMSDNLSNIQGDTILSIDDDEVFKYIKRKFVFSDSASIRTIEHESMQEFGEFAYADWLDNDHLILFTNEYNKPNTFLIFNTKKRQIVDTIIFTELSEICGRVYKIHGISHRKDYFLFSCDGYGNGSGVYQLLGYDLNKREIYNIRDYMEDKHLVYKKTGQTLHNDGREHSLLPNTFSRYGRFSFTKDNGFEIAGATYNYDERDFSTKYFSTIKFPSLQSMVKKNGTDFPIIESDKMEEEDIEKRLYFTNYYDRLPLKIKNGKVYNAPRKNTMFGAAGKIVDEESPYLFLPFTYYLNPKTLTPKFETEKKEELGSAGSMSNNVQARYTGLLVNNMETNELISVFVHGIGVQQLSKRKDNFIITSIFSDYGDNHLVVWDIKKLEPIARLNMKQGKNRMSHIFFDEKNKQIIGVRSTSPATISFWNYYPE